MLSSHRLTKLERIFLIFFFSIYYLKNLNQFHYFLLYSSIISLFTILSICPIPINLSNIDYDGQIHTLSFLLKSSFFSFPPPPHKSQFSQRFNHPSHHLHIIFLQSSLTISHHLLITFITTLFNHSLQPIHHG